MLINQVARELREAISCRVTMKDRAEDAAEIGKPVSGRATYSMLAGEIRHTTREQIK